MRTRIRFLPLAALAGAALLATGCAAGPGPSEPDGSDEATDVMPRLIINGTDHPIGDESYCHYQPDKIRAYSEAADFDESETKMSIFITPDEERSEIAIYPGNGEEMASGHGTWDPETNEGEFDGGMVVKVEDDVLTLSGVFESRVIEGYEVETDYAVECVDEP